MCTTTSEKMDSSRKQNVLGSAILVKYIAAENPHDNILYITIRRWYITLVITDDITDVNFFGELSRHSVGNIENVE